LNYFEGVHTEVIKVVGWPTRIKSYNQRPIEPVLAIKLQFLSIVIPLERFGVTLHEKDMEQEFTLIIIANLTINRPVVRLAIYAEIRLLFVLEILSKYLLPKVFTAQEYLLEAIFTLVFENS